MSNQLDSANKFFLKPKSTAQTRHDRRRPLTSHRGTIGSRRPQNASPMRLARVRSIPTSSDTLATSSRDGPGDDADDDDDDGSGDAEGAAAREPHPPRNSAISFRVTFPSASFRCWRRPLFPVAPCVCLFSGSRFLFLLLTRSCFCPCFARYLSRGFIQAVRLLCACWAAVSKNAPTAKQTKKKI